MSNKPTTACKTISKKNNKNTLEQYKQPLPTSTASPEGVVLYNNHSTLIEVTVKTKGRKRTSTMVSSSPTGHKAIEEKRQAGSSGDSHQSWSSILREQNRPAVKQSLQQGITKPLSSKATKHVIDSKEFKRTTPSHQKHELSHKHLDEIPVKQVSSQRRIDERIKVTPRTTNPSTTSMASSSESILVLDRGVQCGGIFDCPNDRFGAFNPVRMLGFLMKELEHLVKGDKASKILTDMEQVLCRIPTELTKPASADLEAIALRTKLDAAMIQLEETSKTMNAMCETLRDERDSLQRQVHKQVYILNEARDKQSNLEATIKSLKQELESVMKTIQLRENTISELREEIRGQEFSQKVITDLRTNLNEQTELARQRHLEVQYLTLEKEKLSVLSSYKDSLLIELRNAVKDLQTHIAEQLSGLKNAYVGEENFEAQMSLAHGGLACSSPTSTSSRESNIPTSWHDISYVSLSTVEHNPCEDTDIPRFSQKTDKIASYSKDLGNSAKKRTKGFMESKSKELEFISLPGGESVYKHLGYTEYSQMTNNGKGDVTSFSTKKDDDGCQPQNSTNKIPQSDILHEFPEKVKVDDKQTKISPKDRKSSESSKKQSHGKKLTDDTSTNLKTNLSNSLIGPSITEQFQNIFQDIRLQSRIPVNVPSPPRNFPHPDWSDSTLPSISAVSELN